MFGRYKLYKAGTKKLVDWLVASARMCCELKSVIKSLSRSLHQKQSSKANSTAELELRNEELVKLAKVIAAAVPPVSALISPSKAAQMVWTN